MDGNKILERLGKKRLESFGELTDKQMPAQEKSQPMLGRSHPTDEAKRMWHPKRRKRSSTPRVVDFLVTRWKRLNLSPVGQCARWN